MMQQHVSLKVQQLEHFCLQDFFAPEQQAGDSDAVCSHVKLQRPPGDMRPGSPVPSAGRRRRSSGSLSRSLRCSLRGSYRNKSPAAAEEDEPRVTGCCGLPPGRATSRVEILQHVIDYILDLQTELDAFCPAGDRGEPLHRDRIQQRQERPPSGESSGTCSHTCLAASESRSLQTSSYPDKFGLGGPGGELTCAGVAHVRTQADMRTQIRMALIYHHY
ncbi:uncharacterized protein LOC123978278 [Micropterus dolomieu]|uniref:uncharacterized protein LOC123978278 n=1 Tax=Micropterus dolomieu TaxID=147949 RepID=UPI001E8D38C9|nr:uncharacterized protein LOC123978278 [Micropterus dolomieu]